MTLLETEVEQHLLYHHLTAVFKLFSKKKGKNDIHNKTVKEHKKLYRLATT